MIPAVNIRNDVNNKSETINHEERLRLTALAVEKSSHPFLVGKPEGQIVLFNAALRDMLGYSDEELLTLNWARDLIAPEWHTYQDQMIAEILRTGNPLRYEKEYRCKDGSGVPAEVFAHPFYNANGEIVYLYCFINDLTDKRQSLEQLQASKAQLSEIADNMLDIVTKVDANGLFEYCSPSFSSILGYQAGALIGEEFTRYIHPDHRQEVIMKLTKHIKKGLPGKLEYLFRHADGNYLWLETVFNVLKEDGERKVGAVLGSRDITSRKQAELALLKSEDKFSKVFLSNPDPIMISNMADERFVDVNEAFLLCTGYERDQVITRTWSELDIWVDLKEKRHLLNALRKQGSLRNAEIKFRIKSGNIRTMLLSMEIIDINGEPHIVMITKDITERKCMEEALRLSKERFSKAFNASPTTMAITTLEEGRIIDCNDSFCRLFGYSREMAQGRSMLELGIWADPEERRRMKEDILTNGSVRDLESHWRTIDGDIRLGLFSAEVLEIDGEVCLLSILSDITERRQMEIEMTRLDRLNLVGQIAASIGHEIRNPMTTVRGFLQMLGQKPQFEEEADTFALMIEELDRANAIITEFLSLARDKLIKLESKDLNSIVSTMFPLFQANAMAQDKNIEVRLQKTPDLLLDEKEIRQLLLNLVQNGLEAMATGGTLTIKTLLDGESIILSIQDEGRGIESEVIEKLGTPFFTTKRDGTGLGLAVCYGIAERHNACIEIDSDSRGTRFNVRFPKHNGGIDARVAASN